MFWELRLRDGTLENCFFQTNIILYTCIHVHVHAYIFNETNKGKFPSERHMV